MRTRLAVAGVILLLVGTHASAHRLDEYLQATIISVEKDRVKAEIRLTPGVAVFHIVLADIDSDADGDISEAEQRAYAERVLGDLSLMIDGDRLQLRLVSWEFAKLEEMKEGLGDIQLEFNADVARGGLNRRLIFENQHQSRIAAYLVNCQVPSDPNIQITAQDRNYQQSFYQLEYLQTEVRSVSRSFSWWSVARGCLETVALLLIARLALLWRRRGRAANDAIAQE
jgi:hypothetical protein